MRKKPYKAEELFKVICDRITLPDILDYYQGWRFDDKEIRTYEWDFGNHLEFGGNEGIYLTMYAESREDNICLGTFKTLRDTPEAMHIMANLLADFIIEGKKFVNANLDDFTWEGYKVSAKSTGWSYDCGTLERAKIRYKELSEKYGEVTVYDYANRKEIQLGEKKKDVSIEPSDEILYAIDRFKDPLLLELQVWEENTANYFKEKGYAVDKCDDGSWWITDESRYPD